MKKRRGLLFLIMAVGGALILLLAVFFWWSLNLLPLSPSQPAPSKLFVIRKGESLSSIALRLEKEGLIRNAFAFKVLVLVEGLRGKIQAGDFRLRPSLTPKQIAHLLTHGTIDVWVTFPEGLRREEFAQRLVRQLEDFDYRSFLKQTEDLEGYLFPDTYLIPKEASPAMVIEILTANFEEKFTPQLKALALRKGLTEKQVLILASIVEREARETADRPIVAGILLRRWRADWPLQADATVQYALATSRCEGLILGCQWWPSRLTKTDLKIDSPYNTYRYKGLPPTPICNPGLSSIKAVVESRTTDYWFYHSDSQGKMYYAETIEGHNQNVARYLRN